MNWDFFPEELKALPQWMVAGASEGPDYKRPINPKTNKWGSVTDPSTWGTYEEAMASNYPLKGFVFSKNDPYAVIDLDTYKAKTQAVVDGHGLIKAEAGTYTELSQSGLGTHIIGRGSLDVGIHKDEACLEAYSFGRFMICTGNVGADGVIKPIADIQPLLDHLASLFKSRKPNGTIAWRDLDAGEEGKLSDADLIEKIMQAENADKFLRLCQGDLSMHDYDHSRADASLVQFLCYYTPDNEQVARLFRYSTLGEREKAERPDYIPRAIIHARERIARDTPPPIDTVAIAERARIVALHGESAFIPEGPYVDDALVMDRVQESSDIGPVIAPVYAGTLFPPGLIGEVAAYVMAAAPRPVPEIALASAIAVVAGVAGRQYNCSRPATGLNQYILLLAATGVGKEAAQQCIDALFMEVRKTVAASSRFQGPARFASGAALGKQFQKQPCFVSVLGEFGDKLKELTNARNEHGAAFLGVLKDVYNKSGWRQVLHPSVYSNKDNDTEEVRAPSLTVLAETAPETFFEALDESLIASGLLPRFLVIEYAGDRNDRIVPIENPPAALVRKFAELCTIVLQMEQNNTCSQVQMSAEAIARLDEFDRLVDNRIRGSTEVVRQMWNRAHFKALRLASLVAVGVNALQPIVSDEAARWAIELVTRDVAVITSRFARGDVGDGDSKLRSIVSDVVTSYLTKGNKRFAEYHTKNCIASRFLSQQTLNRPAFKKHRLGASNALKGVLDTMVLNGELILLDRATSQKWFKTTSTVYTLGDHWG
jgi:hypothetical protein